jgi:hypothetical protein
MTASQSVALSCFLLLSPIFASEEDIATWLSVSVTAQPSKPFERVQVFMEVASSDFDAQIKALRITLQGHDLSFPKEAIADLRHPLLNTVWISSEAGYDKDPWLYISFELGMPESKRGMAWDSPRIYLAFQNGKFIKRFTSRRKSEGGRTFTDEWKP